ncbi:hypothetical protein AB0F43_06255 [Kribbella sp. NPDC023972]|uniref:hypothetical protein n=1 Tax=Kribbella sp. NPDC023972 TaxID=3154795 RepID=UPI0033E51FDC
MSAFAKTKTSAERALQQKLQNRAKTRRSGELTAMHKISHLIDLWESGTDEIGVLVYAGLFLAEDASLQRILRKKAKTGVVAPGGTTSPRSIRISGSIALVSPVTTRCESSNAGTSSVNSWPTAGSVPARTFCNNGPVQTNSDIRAGDFGH